MDNNPGSTGPALSFLAARTARAAAAGELRSEKANDNYHKSRLCLKPESRKMIFRNISKPMEFYFLIFFSWFRGIVAVTTHHGLL